VFIDAEPSDEDRGSTARDFRCQRRKREQGLPVSAGSLRISSDIFAALFSSSDDCCLSFACCGHEATTIVAL